MPHTPSVINTPVLRRFARLLAKEKLAHAYLLVGSHGIGKYETALATAKLILCDRSASADPEMFCGQCPACRRVESRNHPDFLTIEAGEETSIKIAQVRDAIGRTQLKPFEGRKKIFIIRDVETLTPEAGNALLKTLEEPARDNLLLLTTSSPEKILSTIKSRCHTVHLFPSSEKDLAVHLKQDYGMADPQAHFLAHFAQGCSAQAVRLGRENFFDRKNEIVDNVLLRQNSEVYVKAILSDKNHLRETLTILLFWFRDLCLLKVGVDRQRIVHADRIEELRKLEPQYSFQQLKDIVEQIVDTARLLEENLNVKIPFTLLKEKIWARL